MANMGFQTIVLAVAGITFIITLGLVGFLISSKQDSDMKWPPVTGDCPDYWLDMKGDGSKCVNKQKLGTCMIPGKNALSTPFTPTFTKNTNTTTANAVIDTRKNSNVPQCKGDCVKNQQCEGFLYDNTSHQCSFVGLGTEGETELNGTDYYVRDTPKESSKYMNFSVAPYAGTTPSAMCSKYTWAKNCGVTWDGITTATSNPCNTSTVPTAMLT